MRFGMGYDAWTGGPRGGFGHGGRAGGEDMRGGFGGGRGGGRRRMFDGGEFRLVLLALIAETPRHGYDLIRALEERTSGAYVPSPGVVYPTLTMLADMGHIDEQPGEGARKRFAITAEGQAFLDTRKEDLTALIERIDALGQESERTSAMPVRRAMHNLKAVLMHKLSEEEGDRERLHAIVALIDETAQKIERL